MVFPSRRNKGSDAHLDRKIQFFFGGAVLAFVGMWLDSGLIVGLAICVLLMGFGLRFLPGRGGKTQADEDDARGDRQEERDRDAP